MSRIPVGLQLHIHSWENDGDSPSVETLNGLCKEDVQFYMELLKLFGSTNRDQDNFGNAIDANPAIVGKAVLKVYLAHPKVTQPIKDQFDWLTEINFSALKRKKRNNEEIELEELESEDDETSEADELRDGLMEIMGELLGTSEFYDFRVFDYAEIYEIKTPINDVTSKFKKRKSRKKVRAK